MLLSHAEGKKTAKIKVVENLLGGEPGQLFGKLTSHFEDTEQRDVGHLNARRSSKTGFLLAKRARAGETEENSKKKRNRRAHGEGRAR